jgi:flagellar motility protein MotE (MotC chaperone)
MKLRSFLTIEETINIFLILKRTAMTLYLISLKFFFSTLLLLFVSATISFANEDDTLYQSVEERRIYALMQEERNKIEQERKDLELREKELKTLEVSVDKKIAEIDAKLERLQNLQNRLEALLAEKTAEENKRIKDLGAIYDKMAPERAALAMSGMEPLLATEILANMKPKTAAKVLDMLDKQKSSQLSTTFTTIQIE